MSDVSAAAGYSAALTSQKVAFAVLAKVHQVIDQQQQSVLSLLESAAASASQSAEAVQSDGSVDVHA